MKKSRIARPIAAVEPPAVRSLPLVELLVDTKADAHQARAATVVDAATTAAAAHRVAAEAWDVLATRAAPQASDCRRGAALADRTRQRWAR